MSEWLTEQELQEELQDEQPKSKVLELRPYQQKAVDFHISNRRSFNTFQPGLGKTETGIALGLTPDLQSLQHQNLIVCPSFLTDMWFDRILQYRPNDRIVMASGTRKQRERALRINADWYIVNYEMLHARPPRKERLRADGTKIHSMPQYSFPDASNIIFDEAHHLKSTDSKHAQAARDLVANKDLQVTMLTGTPIKREPDDLFMPLSILYPHEGFHGNNPALHFSSYMDFVRRYCHTLPTGFSLNVTGTRNVYPLQWLMDQCAFHTSYEEAGIYRPEVDPLIIRVTLDPNHKSAYDQIAEGAVFQDIHLTSSMAVMHALRAVTCCPAKIKAAVNIADQFDGVLFYVLYKHSARLLKEHLDKAIQEKRNANSFGFMRRRNSTSKLADSTVDEVPIIYGDTPKAERWNILKSKPPYLICTLQTGSEGIDDLTHMQAVVFFEETHTPLEIEQGIDRARRAGNLTNKVNVYFLHAKNTIDEVVHQVQDRRGVTAEYIVRKTLERYKRLMKQDPEKYIQAANV